MLRMIVANTKAFHTSIETVGMNSILSSGQSAAVGDDLIAQSRSTFRFIFSRIFGRVN